MSEPRTVYLLWDDRRSGNDELFAYVFESRKAAEGARDCLVGGAVIEEVLFLPNVGRVHV